MAFSFHDEKLNFLYMNGVITYEKEINEKNETIAYVKFNSPFIQKCLFRRFSRELFEHLGTIKKPFEDLSDTFTGTGLHIPNQLCRYEAYLKANKDWLLKDAPRRKDMRIYEAIYHFNLFSFLQQFFNRRAIVHPEFPTGNGKIDLKISYQDEMYDIEIKSFSDEYGYNEALLQAARYAKSLSLQEITLAAFVDYIPDDIRQRPEVEHTDKDTNVKVMPVFIETQATKNKNQQ